MILDFCEIWDIMSKISFLWQSSNFAIFVIIQQKIVIFMIITYKVLNFCNEGVLKK